MSDRVQNKLWHARRSIDRLRLQWAMVAMATTVLILLGSIYAYGSAYLFWQRPFWIAVVVGCLIWIVISRLLIKRAAPSSQQLAELVEGRYPDLKQSLLTAVDPQVRLWSNPILGKEIRDKTLHHANQNRWSKVVSGRQRILLGIVNLMLLGAFIGLAMLVTSRPASARVKPATPDDAKLATKAVKIDPGTIDVERGSSITVSAMFGEANPLEVRLLKLSKADEAEANAEEAIAMRRALKELIYTQLISNIQTDIDYAIRFDGEQSETYRLKVFDYPALERSDAILVYPAYTDLPENRIENTKRVRMVEGTQLTWQLYLNKPVQQCRLIDEDNKVIESTASPDDPKLRLITMSPIKSSKLRLELKDDAGRGTKLETTLQVTVVPNLPPTIKLTAGADRSVSPLEEWLAAADVADDHGVLNHGVSYSFAGTEHSAPPLAVARPSPEQEGEVGKKVSTQHQFDMEAMAAKPDDLVTYWFWAEDHDADGAVRRTSSDLYFAEVRPFEEIFRQGQNPGGQQQQQQQSGNGQQAEELMKLQKQIISATWNSIRNNERLMWEADLATLAESQASALSQLQELQSELNDNTSMQAATEAQQAMQKTLDVLGETKLENWSEKLTQALTTEQAAYQALLRLRAREHEIVQSQNQQASSSGASSSQRQQQIDELQLDQEQDRYEMQSQAQEAQEPADEATRDVQNRLEELAQRQNDLNEEIRQLESALQAANDEEAKRELEEQLKRLREAQQDMLQDTDELLEEMQNASEQSDALKEAEQQTQDIRENLQEAAESLEQGQTSQALSSGTRAQEQLDEAHVQLRQQSAEGLQESLRDLRSQAQQLAEDQQAVRDAMQNRGSAEENAGLRSETSKEDLQQKIQQQREDLKEMQQSLEETVLNAEETEPLLAESLYQTFQDAQKERLDEKLEAQSMLMDRAMPEEALKLADQTLEQLQEMEQQIFEAAADVLGNEEADLERAQQDLQRLRNQVARDGNDPADQTAPSDNADPSEQSNPSDQANQQPSNQSGQPSNQANQRPNNQTNLSNAIEQMEGPITGDAFREFNQTLRDVERLLEDRDDQAIASDVRQAARQMRSEYRRHSKEPNQELVEKMIVTPLEELIDRVGLELHRKRAGKNAIVPLDNDPVPPGFDRAVQIYYENLGTGR
jgi:hypothetical protein